MNPFPLSPYWPSRCSRCASRATSAENRSVTSRRSTPAAPCGDLLSAVSAQCGAAAARDHAERDAAAARCWLAIQRLADGDASGGADPAKFAADLDACGLTLADVRSAVDEINACRRAQAAHALAVEHIAKAADEVTAAVAERDAAKAALAACEVRRTRALDVHADAGEVVARATAALNEARALEAQLRSRGYGGSPLVTQPLPLPRKPRRWEVVCDLFELNGRYLKRGSVVELPNDVVLAGNTARPVSINEPLREIVPQPGEPGGLSAVDEEMRGREVLA